MCTQSSRDVYPIIKLHKIENQIKQEIKGFHDKKLNIGGKETLGNYVSSFLGGISSRG
jgi:hypothetical protein